MLLYLVNAFLSVDWHRQEGGETREQPEVAMPKLLHLKGMKITHFGFKNSDKELRLAIKPYWRCPRGYCPRYWRTTGMNQLLTSFTLFSYQPKTTSMR